MTMKTAKGESADSIKVTWNDPQAIAGNVDEFKLSYRHVSKDPQSTWKEEIVAKELREKIVGGLDANTKYEFTISGHVAPNVDGVGDTWSDRADPIRGLTWSGGKLNLGTTSHFL